MSDLRPIDEIASVVGNHVIASVTISQAERAAGAMDPANLEKAKGLFAANGYIRV